MNWLKQNINQIVEPFMRRGKDKSYTDNDDEVEDFSLS